MDAGFVEATSANIPKIDHLMVHAYYRKNANVLIAGVQNIKTTRATRESYGDDAIGYVQLRRHGSICVVKARVTPEHKVRQKAYVVSVRIDETNEEILTCECHDCAASEGGCKHDIALLYWILRRNDQPSVTSTVCYWKKSTLSRVGTLKAATLSSTLGRRVPPLPPKSGDFLKKIADAGITSGCRGILFEYFRTIPTLIENVSLYHLMLKYKNTRQDVTADGFLSFCQANLTADLCDNVCSATTDQSMCPEWFAVRFARLTASKLFEASRCQTKDGVLTETVLGATKFCQTQAMKRGTDLEKEVLKMVCDKQKIVCKNIGMVMKPEYPFFGASPDAVTDDLCIEIKCPFKEGTVKNYIDYKGKVMKKPFAQIQLQMFLCEKRKGLFCVASPDFETDQVVTIVNVDLDVAYCKNIMSEALQFWKTAIFPRLL